MHQPQFADGTFYFYIVTHLKTEQVHRCSTSVIWLETVISGRLDYMYLPNPIRTSRIWNEVVFLA